MCEVKSWSACLFTLERFRSRQRPLKTDWSFSTFGSGLTEAASVWIQTTFQRMVYRSHLLFSHYSISYFGCVSKQIHFNASLQNEIQPAFSTRPRCARYSSADISGKDALLPPRDPDERISTFLQGLSAEQKTEQSLFYNQQLLQDISVCINQRVSDWN